MKMTDFILGSVKSINNSKRCSKRGSKHLFIRTLIAEAVELIPDRCNLQSN